jgi:DNA-directed RNA polymerase alpha subunit
MLDPTSDLTDDTPISGVELTTRIRNALNAAGLKTVGEVREMSDKNLLSLPDFGQSSLSYLRERLGLTSIDRVRRSGKEPG